MSWNTLIEPEQLEAQLADVVLLDCRFQLSDAGAGARAYAEGHIPTAHYVHLERDLSAPVGEHGGRHPLPAPEAFAGRMAALGIDRSTSTVVYDDNRFAFAARLWWMLRALGYRDVRVLNGGLQGWREKGGGVDTGVPAANAVAVPVVGDYARKLDYQALLAAREAGAVLVDSREPLRYQGVEEPIDPVAGHIPGALNLPWQDLADESGRMLSEQALRERYACIDEGADTIAYCGSGVTACVNLLGMHLIGRDSPRLYPGSWSDWCSRMAD